MSLVALKRLGPRSTPAALGARLTLAALLLNGLLLAVVTLLVGRLAIESTNREVARQVSERLATIARSIDDQDRLARAEVQRQFQALSASIDTDALPLEDFVQGSRAARDERAPSALALDRFSADTGAAVTVLLRRGDHLQGLYTTIRRSNGERAAAPSPDPADPALARVLAGQGPTGSAVWAGRTQMVRWKPLFNAERRVIGALAVAIDTTDAMTRLRQELARQRLFDTGSIRLLPLTPGSGATLRAAVMPVLGQPDRVQRRYLDEAGQWLLLAEYSLSESLAGVYRTLRIGAGLLALSLLAFSLVLWWLAVRLVSRPLSELQSVLNANRQRAYE